MKKKETTENSLIKTLDQARFAFPMLLEEKQKEQMIDGIYILVEKLDNPEINKLLDRYPELLQKYNFKELLSGNIDIPNASRQVVLTAGIVSCLLTLISSCLELTDDKNKILPLKEIKDDNIVLQTIQYVISSISLEKFLQHLLFNIISIVGPEYYENFQQKIKSENFGTKDILKLDKDLEVKEHIGLMLWFALIRLFLESVYFYFNPENHETKIKS